MNEPPCVCGHDWKYHGDRAVIACLAACNTHLKTGYTPRCPCDGYKPQG